MKLNLTKLANLKALLQASVKHKQRIMIVIAIFVICGGIVATSLQARASTEKITSTTGDFKDISGQTTDEQKQENIVEIIAARNPFRTAKAGIEAPPTPQPSTTQDTPHSESSTNSSPSNSVTTPASSPNTTTAAALQTTPTPTPTPTPTIRPTATPSSTPVATVTPAPTPKPTSMPTPAPVTTPRPSSTPVPTPIPSPTPQALPDLVITRTYILESPIKKANWGYLMVEIKNQGTVATNRQPDVYASITAKNGQTTSCEQHAGKALNPGESIEVSLLCIVYESGTATAQITVNNNNVIPETTRSNNTNTFTFTVAE